MIISKVPLRISLCGGGTDIPSFYEKEEGGVVSFAIDKYVYVSVKGLPVLFPYNYKLSYSKTELAQNWNTIDHPIIKECIRISKLSNLDLNSMADIPAGTGMGSSSAFTVACLQAMFLMNQRLLGKEELASLASYIEIERLKEPIGKQDQYASAFGGLNYITFKKKSTKVTPVILDQHRHDTFMESLSLFFLNMKPRSASEILKDIPENTDKYATLSLMATQAKECVKVLTQGTIKDLGDLLRLGWELKKHLSNKISNPEIETAIDKAYEAGAYGAKVLGAGGSGFLLVCHSPKEKANILTQLNHLVHVPFSPDYLGARSHYL